MENLHPVSYSGDKPYVFVSYAHKDAEVVVPLVQALQNDGYRIWFDMGIEVGTEWSNDIAAHLRDCALFVAFTSKNSVNSENCLDEIAYAKSHQKPALMVFLEEEVVLPEGTEMQTARFQRMYYNRIGTVEGFMASVNNSTFFTSCREVAPVVPTVEPEVPASPQPTAAPVAPVVESSDVTPKKNKKGLLIGLIAAVSAVAVLCVLLLSGVLFSVDPASGKFSIDGVEYQLPMSLSELMEDGWSASEGLDEMLDGLSGSSLREEATQEIELTKNDKVISVACYNDTAAPVALKDAKIYGIGLFGATDEISSVYSTPNVELAGGITIYSTREDVISAYGEPSISTGDNYIYGDDISVIMNDSETISQDVNFLMFTFDDLGKISYIALVNLDI